MRRGCCRERGDGFREKTKHWTDKGGISARGGVKRGGGLSPGSRPDRHVLREGMREGENIGVVISQ